MAHRDFFGALETLEFGLVHVLGIGLDRVRRFETASSWLRRRTTPVHSVCGRRP
jgi:hypothetical protein